MDADTQVLNAAIDFFRAPFGSAENEGGDGRSRIPFGIRIRAVDFERIINQGTNIWQAASDKEKNTTTKLITALHNVQYSSEVVLPLGMIWIYGMLC